MSNETQGSEFGNVTGKAEQNLFIDNKAPIVQGDSNTVNINYGQLGKPSLEGNPFVSPQPREGGLIGRETELDRFA